MLGLYPIGAAPIGGLGRTSIAPAPPPLVYRAHASQLAVVVPTRNKAEKSAGARASQFAFVVPMFNIPVPTLGAQMSQYAMVVPFRPAVEKVKPFGYPVKALWGFPLLIQKRI